MMQTNETSTDALVDPTYIRVNIAWLMMAQTDHLPARKKQITYRYAICTYYNQQAFPKEPKRSKHMKLTVNFAWCVCMRVYQYKAVSFPSPRPSQVAQLPSLKCLL